MLVHAVRPCMNNVCRVIHHTKPLDVVKRDLDFVEDGEGAELKEQPTAFLLDLSFGQG